MNENMTLMQTNPIKLAPLQI